MGSVRKINNEFYIEFYARGLLYQQKAGTDEVSAQKMLTAIEDKIAKGEMGIVDRDVDVDIFLDNFIEDCKKNHSSKTCARYASTVQHFESFLRIKYPANLKLSAITPAVMETYKSNIITLKPKLLNLTLILLKDCFDFAIKLGYLNDNPVLHTKLVEYKSTSKRQLPSAELMEQIWKEHEDTLKKVSDNREIQDEIKFLLQKSALMYRITTREVRDVLAYKLMERGVKLNKLYKYLGFDDIAKVLRYASQFSQKLTR